MQSLRPNLCKSAKGRRSRYVCKSWPDDPAWDPVIRNPQRFEKEQLQTRDYDKTRALLNRLYPNRGHVLEIGSGFGSLLQTFRMDGWKVTGVEPDRNLARYTTAKLNIETINGIFSLPISKQIG